MEDKKKTPEMLSQEHVGNCKNCGATNLIELNPSSKRKPQFCMECGAITEYVKG